MNPTDNPKLYHSVTNFVTEKYNPSTSSASGSYSSKQFYRKTDPNYRKDMLSRERKRRCAQITESDVQMCYISSSKEKDEEKKSVNSRTKQALTSPRNVETRQKQKVEVQKKKEQSTKNPEKSAANKRTRSRTKTDKLSQTLQIQQLRLLKISLNREIRTLKHEIEVKDQKIEEMHNQLQRVTEQLNKGCQKCEQKLVTITQLSRLIQQQRAIMEEQEQTLKIKNQSNTDLYPHEDIEKLLSDVHKNFSQMSITESKLHEQSKISNEHKNSWIILSLQEKIKYQQIEIAMMKKYKFDQHRIQEECQRYRAQNKFLFSKIRILHEEKEKKSHGDYSISFDLSREEDGSSIVL